MTATEATFRSGSERGANFDGVPPEHGIRRAGAAELVVRRVRLAALRRLLFLEAIWEASTPPPGWTLTIDQVELVEVERRFLAENPDARGLSAAIADIEAELAGPAGVTRRRVIEVFRLDEGETDLLDIHAARALDSTLGAIFRRLDAGAPASQVPDSLVAMLFQRPPRPIWRPASPLALWGLLSDVAPTSEYSDGLEIDPRVLDWFRGVIGLDTALIGSVNKVAQHEPLPSWPLDDAVRLACEARAGGLALRFIIRAAAASGRTSFAACVTQKLGAQLLVVDANAARSLGQSFGNVFMRAQRLAHMGAFALAWRGAAVEPWPVHLGVAPLQFVIVDVDETPPAHPDLADIIVDLPQPSASERAALWRRLVASSTNWSDEAIDRIAATAAVGIGDIAAVARGRPATPVVALDRMRARIRGRLEELGRLVDTPFEWDDLVLPDPVADALRDIAFEAAHRDSAIAGDAARRLYGRPGLATMFSGPPGTGKTMAAQVVARVLGRDLLVVDTATTQSKFIGDTAKNLKRIFNGVRGCPVVVLFDEADAFFAKRTEVRDSNDRYANADTNYLLQLVEDFDGVVILATNQRTNIDHAFVRRLRHVIEFPRPDAQHRIALWHRYLSTVAGPDVVQGLGALIASVAADVELSPAQIKGASLSARLAAMRNGGPLDAAAFIKGIERELAKEGRSLGPRDRERILAA